MKNVISGIITLLLLPTYLLANPEITLEISGGATMDFVWIEPGTFMMGSSEGDLYTYSDEQPQHEVTISQGFWLGKYEVTQGQWMSALNTTPWLVADWKGAEYFVLDPDRPAVSFSRSEASNSYGEPSLVEAMNQIEGDPLFRLPTKAEWEYACRAGTTTMWSFGDDESLADDYAWSRENSWDIGRKYASKVGTKLPNPWGLYDMHGNVDELVEDCYKPYISGSQVDYFSDPLKSCTNYAIRGGGWTNYSEHTRSAIRFLNNGRRGSAFSGVRLVWMGSRYQEIIPTTILPKAWGEIKTKK